MPDTTTVAGPGERPADRPRPTRLRRAVASIAVGGLVVVGTAGLAFADLAPTAPAGGAAARFVPPDGYAALATAGDGSRTIHESARDTGPSLLLEEPAGAVAHLFSEIPFDVLGSAQLWRDMSTPLDTPGVPLSSIYLLDDSGVSLLTATGAELGFSYLPGLVVLPADAAPGASWTGEGSAIPGGAIGYTTAGEVAAGDHGCLVTTTDTRYLDAATGEELLQVVDTATWCPGRGVVADRADSGSGPITVESRPLPDVDTGLGGDVDPEPVPLELADAADWTVRPLAFQRSDPAFGDSPRGTPFEGIGATTADGSLVLAATGRLTAFRVDGATATQAWGAAPGGDVLQVAALGELVLVSTSERRLVAYDQRGVRLWNQRFPDVVLARPEAVGADLVAVSLDGTLRRIDAATGETVWSIALRTDVAQAPAVVGGTVVVVDRGSTVIARSLEDGSAVWRTELEGASRVAAGEGILAAQGTTTDVWRLDPADGAIIWHGERPGAARLLLVTAELVVAQSDEGTTAFATGSGARRWTDAAAGGLAGDGTRILLTDAQGLRVRDAAGELEAQLEVPVAGAGTTRFHLPWGDAVRVINSDGTGWLVAP
ncbi:PQQ-binding-like beta-propeller repeat protein [Protaetiibacter larvae]|uniref:PQQ-binding-like beta-propeller repeat protein n=1 Tax=Protaetiibacter larvae TaxID=2592654 RepID=A0A5C1Y5M4_9MICO|nr:PQQ-binding-like beta-propeller repeat protein [Protaetiibacter larvae]QEO09194.1 PQQ-binding-like beta-propeller repeat protein [Protaetiibacter larvae]